MVSMFDYDQETKKVSITISSYFVGTYFKNFEGLVTSGINMPELEITKTANKKVVIVSFKGDPDLRKYAETYKDIFTTFEEAALRKELKSTEFIPLDGYSYDNLSNEIKGCVAGKRKLCIIKNFDEYLNRNNQYMYHQHVIEYGTQEYYDTVVLIYEKKFDELKAKYADKLVLESWIMNNNNINN